MNIANNQKIKIEYLPINQLKLCEYNPRIHPDKTIDQVAESIRRDGFVQPVLLNSHPSRKNNLIAGNLRVKAAKKLGMKSVPAMYLEVANLDDEKRLNLALNRLSGEWDYELLQNFPLETLLASGFDDIDLSHIWDENLSVEEDEFDVSKAIAAIKTPKTKPGDLIYFDDGWHRLYCGDSLDPTIFARLVGTEKVSILDYDPIYNIGLDYKNGFGTKGKYGSLKIDDKKPDNEYQLFLKTSLQNGLKHSLPDLHVFCWCDQKYIGMLQSIYQELGIVNKRVCIWVKNSQNPTPQVAFNKAYEPCVYGTVGNPYLSQKVTNFNEILNREISTGNRLPDDILDLFDIWLAKREATSEYEHPTQKPPSLYEKPLRRCSKPGDIVLDLFAGSSPLLSACEQLKRRAFLAEIDPVFCDVIVARYRELTGREPKYVSSKK